MSDNKNMIEEDENDTVDYRDDDQEGGIFRWMSVFVVILAIAGFFSLAWYAYKSGGEVTSESDAELITADASPVKQAPENPGGIAIPNQDKAVYGLVGGKQEESKGVEHILSSPETPIVHNEESDTGSWMSEEVKEKLKASEGEKPETTTGEEHSAVIDDGKEVPKEKKVIEAAKEAEKAKEEAKETVKEVVKAAEEKTEADAKEEPKQEEAKKEEPKAAEAKKAPVEIKELKLAESEKAKEAAKLKEEAKKQEAKAREVAKAETTAAPASGGARVQLGAFKSEAEAAGQWKKIEKKFSSEVSGKQHYVVRADLGAKGIYYRLQLAPFDSSKEADRYCLSFVSEGQGCMPVKGK